MIDAGLALNEIETAMLKMNIQSPQYHIRVGCQLGPGIAALFPEFTIEHDAAGALLCGALPDQAALHGVLARLRDLGLPLVALAQVPAQPENSAGSNNELPFR